MLPPHTTIIRKKTGGYEILSKDLRYDKLDSGKVYIYYWDQQRLNQIKF